MTERQALRLLRSGSEEALGWFISRYTPYVTAVIYNIIGTHMDLADVEEVAADVFFALWENADKVIHAKAYLSAIARNKAKNKLRELTYDIPLEDDILILDTQSPESCYEQKELSQAVKKAVMRMPQPDREIFLRYYYYYQTMDAISGEMGINLSTVKTKLRRGRAKLKQTLIRHLT